MQGRLYLTPREASATTGRTVGTLANWRSAGDKGPPYVRSGSRILYPADLLSDWLDSTLISPERQGAPAGVAA